MEDGNGNVLAEVEVDASQTDASWNTCSCKVLPPPLFLGRGTLSTNEQKTGGRQKATCCLVSKALPPPLTCTIDMCSLDPLSCNQNGGKDEWGNPLKRSIHSGDDTSFFVLEKRGGKRPFTWKTAAGLFIPRHSLTYPTPSMYMKALQNGLQGIASR